MVAQSKSWEPRMSLQNFAQIYLVDIQIFHKIRENSNVENDPFLGIVLRSPWLSVWNVLPVHSVITKNHNCHPHSGARGNPVGAADFILNPSIF